MGCVWARAAVHPPVSPRIPVQVHHRTGGATDSGLHVRVTCGEINGNHPVLAPPVAGARCPVPVQSPGAAGPPHPAPEGGPEQREGWRGGRDGEKEAGMEEGEEGGEAGTLPVVAPPFSLAHSHPAPALPPVPSGLEPGLEHPQTLFYLPRQGLWLRATRREPQAVPAGPAPGPAPAAVGRRLQLQPCTLCSRPGHQLPARANKVKP